MSFKPARITIGAGTYGFGGDGRRELALINQGIYTFGVYDNNPETTKTNRRYWTMLSDATHLVVYHSKKSGYFLTYEGGNLSEKFKGIYKITSPPFQIDDSEKYRLYLQNGRILPSSYTTFDSDCEKIGKPSSEGRWIEYGVFIEKISDTFIEFDNDKSVPKQGNIQSIKKEENVQLLLNLINE